MRTRHYRPGRVTGFLMQCREGSRHRVRQPVSTSPYRAAMKMVVASGLVAAVLSLLAGPASTPASAATTTTSKHVLSVTPSTSLNPAGQRLVVTGKGYDPHVGIYVALCVIPAPGQPPSPCGGGVNMSAASPSSVWISSNPPPYGAGLAKPYGRAGTFRVTLQVTSMIGDVDCRTVSCAVVTRADHTRSGDRRFDVVVPVTFQ